MIELTVEVASGPGVAPIPCQRSRRCSYLSKYLAEQILSIMVKFHGLFIKFVI